jgi:CheY-like chemotaxis protein
MDGYEATLQIRQQESNLHTPIIALTASIMPDEMQKCLSVGFNDSISKPIIRENFYRIVLKWLDNN